MRLPNDDFFMTRVLTAMYHFGNNLRSKLHKSAVRLRVPNAAPARAEPAHADESPSDLLKGPPKDYQRFPQRCYRFLSTKTLYSIDR
jgi:hypothetical protein